MSERDERLRQLLRDADPAREVPELAADDVTRLRRTVLSAVDREERPWSPRPSFALAFAAATAAVVLGLALWRFGLTWKSAPNEDRAASSVGPQMPSGHYATRPSTTQEASPAASASSTTASTATRRNPSVAAAAGSAATGHAELASAHHDAATEETLTRRRGSERAIDSARAGATTETARAETLAAAQPASEPQQPYQLQLTAPGGTRIVWLLTSSSGR